MNPTRIRGLVTLALVCAGVTWLLLVHLYTALPPLPWTPVLSLLLLAVLEARVGQLIRAKLSGRAKPQPGLGGRFRWRDRPLQPMAIVRVVAIAKASALAATAIGGIAAGFVLDLVRSLSAPVPRSDTYTALGILASAVILTAAAVYLERSCRVPGPPPDAAHPGPPGPPGSSSSG